MYDGDLQLVHLTPEQIEEVDKSTDLQKITQAWLQVRENKEK